MMLGNQARWAFLSHPQESYLKKKKSYLKKKSPQVILKKKRVQKMFHCKWYMGVTAKIIYKNPLIHLYKIILLLG